MDKVVEWDVVAGTSASALAVTAPAAAIGAPLAVTTPASCNVKESQAVAPPKRKASQAVAPPKRNEDTFSESPEAKKQNMELLRGAERLNNTYLDSIAQQASIERSIESDDKYIWANNEWVLNKFKKYECQVEEVMHGEDFNIFYLMNDLAACKSQYGTNLDDHLRKFMTGEESVKTLKKEQS